MANSKFILVRIIDTEYVPEEGGGVLEMGGMV